MSSTFKILPLGGLGEIGMNCMIFETDDEIILVDCGLLFSDLDHFGVEFVIPDFSYLVERKDKVKGLIVTHAHEDHIGAISYLLKAGVVMPVYATDFSCMLIQEKVNEAGMASRLDLKRFKSYETISFKRFNVTPVPVNHSIIEAHALFIDTPAGKVIHTGDFKIDPEPFYGRTIELERFRQAGDKGVLLLLSDSTNVERHTHTLSESTIYKKFEHLLASATGLTVVSMFASNVARMGQVFEVAEKLGKKIVLAGRSMDQNARFSNELGYIKNLNSVLIPLDEIQNYPRNKVIVVSTGSQGEYRSSLIRIAHGEHKQIQLTKGDLVLMSSKFIPGNEIAIGRMINALFKQGAEVLYEAIHEIHSSGHATRPELKTMIEATKPKFFIPIHGEYRHLVHHAALAKECGIDDSRVVVATNGDVIEVSKDSVQVVEKREDQRVLLENRAGQDITKSILKDRRNLGEKGVVFALAARDPDTRRVVSGPQVILKGIIKEELEPWYVEEAEKVACETVDRYEQELREHHHETDLEENLRVELRRFFNLNLGKKPTVIPLILDL